MATLDDIRAQTTWRQVLEGQPQHLLLLAMLAVAAFTPQAGIAALYYMVHSTFAAAALFLLADLVISRRGDGTLQTLPATAQNGLFAALFFAGAIAMAGMPPLSGFLGKLLVLDAVRAPDMIAVAWGAVLIGSLVTIVGFGRAGSVLFWKSTAVSPAATEDEADSAPAEEQAATYGPGQVAPVMATLALLAALSAFAGPAADFFEQASMQLHDASGYVDAVLGEDNVGKPRADAGGGH